MNDWGQAHQPSHFLVMAVPGDGIRNSRRAVYLHKGEQLSVVVMRKAFPLLQWTAIREPCSGRSDEPPGSDPSALLVPKQRSGQGSTGTLGLTSPFVPVRIESAIETVHGSPAPCGEATVQGLSAHA
jgi:hypothetical protein